MTEEIIIDKEDKTKKHRNNEIDCLHFCCRKGESGNVLFWCDFYDDHCDNYTGCYYRKYLRLEQENRDLKKQIESDKGLITVGGKQQHQYLQMIDELEQENKELKEMLSNEPKAMQAFQISYSGLKRDNETLWGMVKDYKTALEEILESAKFAQCLPCGSGNLEDCLNCNDDTTNNGQFCMEKRIHDIKTKCVEVLNDK